MDKNRFDVWVQLLGNLAIVAGLGIVIFELNQSKQLAYAQLLVQELSEFDSQFISTQGEDPRLAFFKAEFCPGKLNPEDVVTLSAYYERGIYNWLKIYRTNEIASLERPWREVVKKDVRTVFSSDLARRWLNAYLTESENIEIPIQVKEIAIRALTEPPGRRRKDLYIALLPENSNPENCGVIDGK